MPAQPVTSGSRNEEGIELPLVLGALWSIRSLASGVFRHSLERMDGLNASSSRLLATSISNSRLVGKFILFLSKDVDAQCFRTCVEKKERLKSGAESGNLVWPIHGVPRFSPYQGLAHSPFRSLSRARRWSRRCRQRNHRQTAIGLPGIASAVSSFRGILEIVFPIDC
jgi:hypothetical protein